MTIRKAVRGAVLGLVCGLVFVGVAEAKDTPTFTNADLPRLAQSTSADRDAGDTLQTGPTAFTNDDLRRLPRTDNSRLPAVAPDELVQTEPTVSAEPTTAAMAESARWLAQTLTRLDHQRRYDELQRRIRTLTERLEFLVDLGRRPGDVVSAGMTDTNKWVSRGVADEETPRLTERRRVGAELANARVELALLLSESND